MTTSTRSLLTRAGCALAVVGSLAGAAHAATLRGQVRVLPEDVPGVGLWVQVERLGPAIEGFARAADRRPWQPLTVYTDAKGGFLLENLPSGRYSVAMREESLPRRLCILGRPKRTVLVSDSDRAQVRLEVSTQARIDGTVVREDGTPIRGSQVVVYHRGERTPFERAETDEIGRFTAVGLPPGETVLVEARAPEGVFRRVETTPLQAGGHTLRIELPVWSRLARQRLVVDVGLPRVGESPLLLEWRSTPADAAQGFLVEVSLGRDGRAEFESPPGVYSARVRELGLSKRRWEAERLYRVEESSATQHFSITVQEIPSEKAVLSRR